MTTFQQAIDYVNKQGPALFAGTPYTHIPYRMDNLLSDARLAIEGVRVLLEKGHTVDHIPPRGREPVAIYKLAEKELEKLSIDAFGYQNVSEGSLNIPAGRVYMAMLDNPPANAPKPSEGYTQADMDAAVNKALDAVSKAVEGARR